MCFPDTTASQIKSAFYAMTDTDARAKNGGSSGVVDLIARLEQVAVFAGVARPSATAAVEQALEEIAHPKEAPPAIALDTLSWIKAQHGNVPQAIQTLFRRLALYPGSREAYHTCLKLLEGIGSRNGIEVFVAGRRIQFNVQPLISDDRLLVPIRSIAQSLDAGVTWDGQRGRVVLTRGRREVVLEIGSRIAWVNGEEVQLDVPPKIFNGRALVPARIISEAFGFAVSWDSDARAVYITTFPVQ